MESMALWEQILLGVLVVFILMWFGPSIKPALANSRQVEKDWPGFLVPIGAVILFVILLIMIA